VARRRTLIAEELAGGGGVDGDGEEERRRDRRPATPPSRTRGHMSDPFFSLSLLRLSPRPRLAGGAAPELSRALLLGMYVRAPSPRVTRAQRLFPCAARRPRPRRRSPARHDDSSFRAPVNMMSPSTRKRPRSTSMRLAPSPASSPPHPASPPPLCRHRRVCLASLVTVYLKSLILLA
jgi:hypothetical protein